MPAEPHPNDEELRRLTLRGALGLAVRCARRVLPILAERQGLVERGDIGLRFAEEICHGELRSIDVADQLPRLYGQSLPNAGAIPRDPRLDVENAVSAVRCTTLAAANVCWCFRDPTPHEPCCDSAYSNAAEAISHAGLVTALTLEWIPLDEAHRLRFEEQYPKHAREAYSARDAVWSDYWRLLDLCGCDGGIKLGEPIDVSENGPLGTLWPHGTPDWYIEQLHVMGVLSRPVTRIVRATEEAQEILAELCQPGPSPIVLLFGLGQETGDFADVGELEEWLEDFRKQSYDETLLRDPTLLVLADPAVATPRIAIEFGAVVLDRNRWGIADLQELVASFTSVPAVSPIGNWLTFASRQVEPAPSSAEPFSRQPSHVEPFDEQTFEQVLKGLNASPWWSLDY